MRKFILFAHVVLVIFGWATKPAHADPEFSINQFNVFGFEQIVVSGSNGNYTKIDSQTLNFEAFINASFYGVSKQNLRHKFRSAFLFIPSADPAIKYTEPESYYTSVLAPNYYPVSIVTTTQMQVPIWKLGNHKQRILNVCNNLIAQGKSQSEDHIGKYTIPVKAILTGGIKRIFKKKPDKKLSTKSRSTTGEGVEVLCKRLKAPPRAGDRFKIVSLGANPEFGDKSCPRRHDLKVVFRALGPKTFQFRVHRNRTTTSPHTLSLHKTDKVEAGRAVYEAKFTKQYKLNPGDTTFQVRVIDGPKSKVLTKTVTCPPFRITATKLNYAVENVSYCPKNVLETATYTANRPGRFKYKIVREDGKVMAEGRAEAKRKGSEYVAVVKRPLKYHVPYTIKMQAQATPASRIGPRFEVNSGWKTLKIGCLKMLSSSLKLSDPKNDDGQCTRQGGVNAVMIFDQPGKSNIRISCDNGFSKTTQAVAKKNVLSGDYRATAFHYFNVEKTGKVTCFLQDADHDYKFLAADAKDYVCKPKIVVGAGPGQLKPTELPDPDAPKSKWQGTLTVANTARSNVCPRHEDQVFFDVSRPEPGSFRHYIGCSNGDFFSGTTAPIKSGNVYKALGAYKIRVAKTRKIQCTLQEVKSGGVKVTVAKADQHFRCKSPIAGTGSPDITVDANPPAGSARQPVRARVGTGVAKQPSARWKCPGGKQKNNVCTCPPHRKLTYGPIEYHGQVFNGSKCVEKDLAHTPPAGTNPNTNIQASPSLIKRRAAAERQKKARAERLRKARAEAAQRQARKAKAERLRKARAQAERRKQAALSAERRKRARARAERRKAKAEAERRRKAKLSAERRKKARARAERRKAKAEAEKRRRAKLSAQRRRNANTRRRNAQAAAQRRKALRARTKQRKPRRVRRRVTQ